MTNLQLVLAMLIPTVTVLTGIIVSNGRFNAMEARLGAIETDVKFLLKAEAANAVTLGHIDDRLAALETAHSAR